MVKKAVKKQTRKSTKKTARSVKKTIPKAAVKTLSKPSADLITKEMNLGEIVQKYPDSVPVLFNHGMHCLGCAAAQFENLGQAAEAHGIDVEKLVDDLNSAVRKKRR